MTRILLAFREPLILLLLYAVAVAALVGGAYQILGRAAADLTTETAQLIGAELATALESVAPEELTTENQAAKRRLVATARAVAGRSAMVEYVTVVGREGEVLAGDEPGIPERRLPPAEQLFGDDPRPRLIDISGAGLAAGHYILEMPLLENDDAVGYLRLTLASEPLGRLYSATRRRLFIAAALGVLLIGALAFLLHLQLRRRAQRLSHELELALAGERPAAPADPGDPFAAALAAAGRAGRTLRAHHDQLREIARLLDVGVLLLGPDGGVDFASPRARELLAVPPAGNWDEIERWLAPALERAWAERGSAAGVEIERDAGGAAALRAVVNLLSEDQCEGYLVLLRDPAPLLALEDDLRLAARLRLLTRIFRSAAHDLRAPLNGLVLHLELLRDSLVTPNAGDDDDAGDTAASEARERRLRWLGVLEEELGRLRRTLGTLLDQTAPGRDEPGVFDLRPLVGEIAALLAPQAERQGGRVDCELAAGELLVHARRDSIKQAALNLAVNGLEAMDGRGTLSLTAARRGGEAVLTVGDDGPGIADEHRGRIFDMHFSTKPRGSGIGLYVTRSLVAAEGGRVELAATGPGGSRFTLALPLSAEAAR